MRIIHRRAVCLTSVKFEYHKFTQQSADRSLICYINLSQWRVALRHNVFVITRAVWHNFSASVFIDRDWNKQGIFSDLGVLTEKKVPEALTQEEA